MAERSAPGQALELKIRVQRGAILCGEGGGSVRASRHPVVRWTGPAFSLEFFLVTEEEEPADRSHRRWPFSEYMLDGRRLKDPPPDFVAGPTKRFEGTLLRAARGKGGVYKYYVTVGGAKQPLRLDPIIIMD
jgi:hypothetical protein